ncbi:MAG: hypothetical protein Q8O89_02635 [Nanoarchaeota archaeon]|nr:hypothetical protein [Nanoarchaeota archaeon]
MVTKKTADKGKPPKDNAASTDGFKTDLYVPANANEAIVPVRTEMLIAGIGGAGGNSLVRLIKNNLTQDPEYYSKIPYVKMMFINTDGDALDAIENDQDIMKVLGGNDNIIRISTKESGGAGGNPQKGKELMEKALQETNLLKGKIGGENIVFAIYGSGKGTGTGAGPVFMEHVIAENPSVLPVVISTMPFGFEGKRRFKYAVEGYENLKNAGDNSIRILRILNEQLRKNFEAETGSTLSLEKAFSVADKAMGDALNTIIDIRQYTGEVNVDIQDIRSVLGEPGQTLLCYNLLVTGNEKAQQVIDRIYKTQIHGDAKQLINTAKGMLIAFYTPEGNKTSMLDDMERIVTNLSGQNEDMNVIFGSAQKVTLKKDELEIGLILTGIDDSNIAEAAYSANPVDRSDYKIQHTGADFLTNQLKNQPDK